MAEVYTGANVLCGIVSVFTGTAGSEATTHVGYTKDGVEISQTENANFIFVDNVDAAIKKITTEFETQVTINVAESTLLNLALPQGSTSNATTVTLGEKSLNENLSLKLVGVNPAGLARTWEFLQARPRRDITHSYVKGDVQMVSLVFDCLHNETNNIVGTMVDETA